MQKISIASPLFLLREKCKDNLYGVLSRIAALGFDGVEFLGFFGKPPEEIAQHIKNIHLTALGNFVELGELVSNLDGVIGAHKTLGCKYITLGRLSREFLPDGEKYESAVSAIKDAAQALNENGIQLLFHNHDGEFYKTASGQIALDRILSDIPALKLEPDIGWMQIAGAEPAHYLTEYKERCPVMDFKDYYADDGADIGKVSDMDGMRGGLNQAHFCFRPVGYGVVNYPVLITPAMACKPEWIVCDHDNSYENDPFDDLALSLSYTRSLTRMAENY